MASVKTSDYPPVTDLAGTELLHVVTAPGSPTGDAVITADLLAASTPMTEAMTAIANAVSLVNTHALVQVKENAAGGGGGGNYMNFPTGANYIDTPSNAAFNVAGDCGFAIRVQLPASTPANDWCVFSRRGATAAATQVSGFIQADGQMHGTVSVNGTSLAAGTSVAASPLVFDGRWLWVRMTRQASSGQWDFYTATDTGSNNILPASWTTFSLNRGAATGAMWNPGTVPFEINGHSAGATNTLAGKIGRVIMYDNEALTGTPILDANASDYTSGSSWTGPSGNVWTLHGTATVVVVAGGATASTTSKFVLADTDPFSTLAMAHRDTGYWFSQGGLGNNSGGSANFTPEIVVNGVVLSTLPAIALANAAGVYRYEFALTFEVGANDGTVQSYAWSMKVYNVVNALGSTYAGSQTSSTVLTEVGGNFTGPVTTFTTVPKVELKMTMSVNNATTYGGMQNTRLSLAKAA